MVEKNIIFVHYYKTTIGELIIGCFEDQICIIDFRYRKMRTAIDHRVQSALNAVFFLKRNSPNKNCTFTNKRFFKWKTIQI